MALNGPLLRYTRHEGGEGEDALGKALELAREIEDLLEDTRSLPGARPDERASSTRMARAIALSLVDELEALVRGARKKTGVA